MIKITCDICDDLFPIVKDGVSSEDSKSAVLEHINTCERCKSIYNIQDIAPINDIEITKKIKSKIMIIGILLLSIGIMVGIGIPANEFMFYNIIIMPIVGGLGYLTLKNKCYYVLITVFVSVYLRWLYDTFGYALNGQFVNAFIGPLWWATIYVFFTTIGVVIAFLFSFGLRREK